MGIDLHAVNLIKLALKKKQLGDVVTMGRQGLHLTEATVRTTFPSLIDYKHDAYCENLLQIHLGASKVESIDNSAYENATYIHDMNKPLPNALKQKFDTVIDGGCTEHIFNVAQSLQNASSLCKIGGQILHILPANNFCGHGFWQFSPELFFSLYSRVNGYEQTEVYLAELTDGKTWYRVKEPSNGSRVNILSTLEVYVLVRTVLVDLNFRQTEVQQSDYVHHWESDEFSLLAPTIELSSLRKQIGAIAPVKKMLLPLYQAYHRWKPSLRLSDRNPHLTRIEVS